MVCKVKSWLGHMKRNGARRLVFPVTLLRYPDRASIIQKGLFRSESYYLPMPKRSRRWTANPVFVGSSPTAAKLPLGRLTLLCSQQPVKQWEKDVEVCIFVCVNTVAVVNHVVLSPRSRNPAGGMRPAMDVLHADEVRDKANQYSREYSGIERPFQEEKRDRIHRKQNDDVERVATKEIQMLLLIRFHGRLMMLHVACEEWSWAMQSPTMEAILKAVRPEQPYADSD